MCQGKRSGPTLFFGALAVTLLAVAPPLAAQNTGTIEGRVTHATSGQPVPAVQVLIADLDLGVLSQQNGTFTIQDVPAGTHTVAAQRLAFQTQSQEVTVVAGETVTVNFQLSEERLALDEILITGTPGGTQRRAIGNVVTQVNAADITDRAQINTMQELLSGRATGLDFMRNSGNIGTGSQIRIRGVSSLTLGSQPLIYVDGVRVNNAGNVGPSIRGGSQGSALDDLNPAEIESIEVIKGPAAATLYGTEASAGVIQIITRRGEEGAPQFDFSMSQGANFMMDPSGKLGDQWGRDPATGELIQFGEYRNVYDYEKNVHGNDVFQYGQIQNYNLAVRGGTDILRYYLSGTWSDTEGVVSYNWDQRANLRGNIGVLLPGDVNLDLSAGYVTGETSYMQQITEGGIWEMMMWARPALMETDRRGFLRYTPEELETIEATREYSRFTGSVQLTHEYGGWLNQRLVVGLDHASDENQVLIPRHPLGASGPFSTLSLGDVDITRPNNIERTVDYSASANYGLTDAIRGTTSFGTQYYSSELNRLEATGSVFASPAIRSIEGATDVSVGQTFVQNKSFGVFVQQELDFNNRIFLTGAVRGDDNSAFGADFDAAIYPKFSATWVMSEEEFWPLDWMNSFRLRSAWGQAGRQPDTFAAVTLYEPAVGPGGQAAVRPNTFGNPNVGPEVSTELEFGFDATMLDNRVSVEATYYTQKTEDALANVALAPSMGFSGSEAQNLGRIDNWGWEFSIDARAVEQPRWSLDLGFSGDHSMNEIKDLGGLTQTNSFREGFPYPVWVTDVILSAEFDEFGQPTNLMCDGGTGLQGREIGGEAVPCSEVSHKRLLLGTNFPQYNWAVDASLNIGNLQLFGLAEGEHGRWGSNTNVYCRHTPCYTNTLAANTLDDPIYVEGVAFFYRHPSLAHGFIRYDAAFWKLREVGARYRLPDEWLQRFGASNASIAVSGRDLWTIWRATDDLYGATIPDPELTSPAGGSALGQMPGISSISTTVRISF